MPPQDKLEDALLRKFVRNFSAGEFLFKAGDYANTMFVIVSGTIQLFKKGLHSEKLIGTLSAGETLGEKAIVKDARYRRNFTAQAKSETTVLEFDKQSMGVVQSKMPDFMLSMVRILSERLDQANELIGILQSQNDAERFVQYLQYFAQHHSRKVSGGTELPMTAEDIQDAIHMDKHSVEECLGELVSKKVLIKQKNGYLLRDEDALSHHIPSLKECLAA